MSGGTGKHNLNKLLHGSTITLSGTEGTATANRAVILDANSAVDAVKTASLSIGASGSEVALTATPAEINRSADTSGRVVTSTATVLALTVTEHGERIVLINSNSTVANTFTLPVATGSGVKMTLVNNIAQTQGTVVVSANGTTDVLSGIAYNFGSTEETAMSFVTSATSDKISLNLTTTGGGVGQDRVEAQDVAANTWNVVVHQVGSGALATPFSAT